MTTSTQGPFGLTEPHSMLIKLEADIGDVARSCHNQEKLKFAGMTAAQTAWHIGDWVAEAARNRFSVGQRLQSVIPDLLTAKNDKDYRGKVHAHARKYDALAVCEAITIQTKHFTVTDPKVLDIESRASIAGGFTGSVFKPLSDDGLGFLQTNQHPSDWPTYILKVEGSNGLAKDFKYVLGDALKFWNELFRKIGL